MSVTHVDLIHQGRDISASSQFVTVYTQTWRVQTNNAHDGPATIAAAPGLPPRYASYGTPGTLEYDPLALCDELSAAPEDDSMKSWIVNVRFSTDALQLTGFNPLLDTVKTSLGFDVFQRVARTDINGNPIANTVGEQFAPFEIDDSRPVLTITKNEAFVNLPLVIAYKDSVNSTSWRGIGPRCAKMKSVSASEISIRNGQQFYTMTYEVHLNADTWDFHFLNEGTYYKKTAGSTNLIGPLPKKVILFLDGTKAPMPYTGDPSLIYTNIRIFKEMDFNSLLP